MLSRRRLRFFIALPLGLFWMFSCTTIPTSPVPSPPSAFQKGMIFVCWSADCFNGSAADSSLHNVAATGSEWVSLVVTWYQRDIHSSNIFENEQTPAEVSLLHAIAQARQLGMKIMLKPHLDVIDGTWRGWIDPADRAAWFAAYREFILHYADLAANLDLEQFVVGTELAGVSGDAAAWQSLIAQVRQRYSGSLLYAASWDECTRIGFWHDLDVAGINAFFPLTNLRDPSLIDLLVGWQFWLRRVEIWQEAIGKPVVFAEIGYTSQDGTNMQPYDFDISSTIDLNEQAECYRAALIALDGVSWLKGLYWWMWRTDLHGGPNDNGYTPYNKPAEQVLKQSWRTNAMKIS